VFSHLPLLAEAVNLAERAIQRCPHLKFPGEMATWVWHIRVLAGRGRLLAPLEALRNGPSTTALQGAAVRRGGRSRQRQVSGWPPAALPGGIGEGHAPLAAASTSELQGSALEADLSKTRDCFRPSGGGGMGRPVQRQLERTRTAPRRHRQRSPPRPSKAAARRLLGKGSAWKGGGLERLKHGPGEAMGAGKAARGSERTGSRGEFGRKALPNVPAAVVVLCCLWLAEEIAETSRPAELRPKRFQAQR